MMASSIQRSLTRVYRVRRGFLLKHWIPSSSSFSTSAAAAVSQTPSNSFAQSQEKLGCNVPKEEKGSGLSKWLLFVPGAVTFGLGTWQIFRRQDKIEMLEYRKKRLEMEPLKFNEISPSSDQLDSLEFRRIACEGVFDEKRSIFVGPRSRSITGVTENGYYVITPLMPVPNDPYSVQSPILVNRGWVPRIWKERSLETSQHDEQPSDASPSSTQEVEQRSWWKFGSKKPKVTKNQIPRIDVVEVIGVIRGSEQPNMYVPENDPISGQWFYIDVPSIARACQLSENTIYVEDINENVNVSCPYPLPKDVNTLIRSSVMPQDHLNYTLTWYSLSAAVTFMAAKRLKPQKSRR